jgi:hypothetical protein
MSDQGDIPDLSVFDGVASRRDSEQASAPDPPPSTVPPSSTTRGGSAGVASGKPSSAGRSRQPPPPSARSGSVSGEPPPSSVPRPPSSSLPAPKFRADLSRVSKVPPTPAPVRSTPAPVSRGPSSPHPGVAPTISKGPPEGASSDWDGYDASTRVRPEDVNDDVTTHILMAGEDYDDEGATRVFVGGESEEDDATRVLMRGQSEPDDALTSVLLREQDDAYEVPTSVLPGDRDEAYEVPTSVLPRDRDEAYEVPTGFAPLQGEDAHAVPPGVVRAEQDEDRAVATRGVVRGESVPDDVATVVQGHRDQGYPVARAPVPRPPERGYVAPRALVSQPTDRGYPVPASPVPRAQDGGYLAPPGAVPQRPAELRTGVPGVALEGPIGLESYARSRPPPPPAPAPTRARRRRRSVRTPPVQQPVEQPAGSGWYLFGLSLLALATVGVVFLLTRPQPGAVVVTVSGPDGMAIDELRVLVDGEQRCVASPCRVTGLHKGVHLVKVVAPGYETGPARSVSIESGSEALVDIALRRAATHTGIAVGALGAGLRLSIDGRDYGPLPVQATSMPPGDYLVEIHGSDRYERYSRRMTIEAGKVQTLTPRLKVLKGRLRVEPGRGSDEAEVLLVSGRRRRFLSRLPATLDLDPELEHQLVAKRDGYHDFVVRVGFEDGKADKRVQVTLTPVTEKAPPPPRAVAAAPARRRARPAAAGKRADQPAAASERPAQAQRPAEPGESTEPKEPEPAVLGTLRINSLPPSRVLVDGHPRGTTPTVVQVSPGVHSVVFIHEEHGRKVVSVAVEGGQSAVAAARFP